ncbi:MAG: exodeoxyribonuclease VII small subunit [Myxococcota bacterium]
MSDQEITAAPAHERGVEGADESRDAESFEAVVERLEDVVAQLEGGDLTLERSLTIFEEGVRLAREGARQLDDAEARVERLLSRGAGVATVPHDEADDEE